MKPYYQDEWATIYHGDCRDILPSLPKVDLVLTDPPYGVNKAEWDSEFNMDWMRISAPQTTNALAIMCGVANLLKLPYSFEGLQYKWTLSLHITNARVRGAIGFGNWIPCVVYVRNNGSVYTCNQDAGEVAISGSMPAHPSPKPHAAMKWLISRLKGEVILDPFMGSGTTLFASKQLNRKCIGIEIEEKYCEIAAKRCSQAVMDLSGVSRDKGDNMKGTMLRVDGIMAIGGKG